MSTSTRAARGTSGDAGSIPATSTTALRRYARWVACFVLGAALVGGGVAVGVATRPTADEAFLQAITFHYQDGYAGRVLYAGHWSCAALHAGWNRQDLIEYGVREGLAGDLYPREGVQQVVTAASDHLCPGAPLPDLIRP